MSQRLNYAQQSPDLFKKLSDLSMALKGSVIEEKLRDLVNIRASQLNGCAFCLDMHVKEAKIHGESELRLYHVAIWRESNLFVPRERAALAWTEAVTLLSQNHVPDDVYEQARAQFSEGELVDLTMAVTTINSWNRLAVSFRQTPSD